MAAPAATSKWLFMEKREKGLKSCPLSHGAAARRQFLCGFKLPTSKITQQKKLESATEQQHSDRNHNNNIGLHARGHFSAREAPLLLLHFWLNGPDLRGGEEHSRRGESEIWQKQPRGMALAGEKRETRTSTARLMAGLCIHVSNQLRTTGVWSSPPHQIHTA